MGQKAASLFWKLARAPAPKYISSAPTSPRPKNSQMAVRKILRFSFSRPWAWASLVSLEMARGSPAVEMVSSTL